MADADAEKPPGRAKTVEDEEEATPRDGPPGGSCSRCSIASVSGRQTWSSNVSRPTPDDEAATPPSTDTARQRTGDE